MKGKHIFRNSSRLQLGRAAIAKNAARTQHRTADGTSVLSGFCNCRHKSNCVGCSAFNRSQFAAQTSLHRFGFVCAAFKASFSDESTFLKFFAVASWPRCNCKERSKNAAQNSGRNKCCLAFATAGSFVCTAFRLETASCRLAAGRLTQTGSWQFWSD